MAFLSPDVGPSVRLDHLQRRLDGREWGGIAAFGSVAWISIRRRCLVLTNPYWLGLTSRIGAPWAPSRGRPSRCSARMTSSRRTSSSNTMDR